MKSKNLHETWSISHFGTACSLRALLDDQICLLLLSHKQGQNICLLDITCKFGDDAEHLSLE